MRQRGSEFRNCQSPYIHTTAGFVGTDRTTPIVISHVHISWSCLMSDRVWSTLEYTSQPIIETVDSLERRVNRTMFAYSVYCRVQHFPSPRLLDWSIEYKYRPSNEPYTTWANLNLEATTSSVQSKVRATDTLH